MLYLVVAQHCDDETWAPARQITLDPPRRRGNVRKEVLPRDGDGDNGMLAIPQETQKAHNLLVQLCTMIAIMVAMVEKNNVVLSK